MEGSASTKLADDSRSAIMKRAILAQKAYVLLYAPILGKMKAKRSLTKILTDTALK